MPKPIVVIYFPDTYDIGNTRNWIYEYARAMNGEPNNKFETDDRFLDYHWFCFYKNDIQEPEFKVFYDKDFDEIKFGELKKLVQDAVAK